jgi:hypothetical protein
MGWGRRNEWSSGRGHPRQGWLSLDFFIIILRSRDFRDRVEEQMAYSFFAWVPRDVIAHIMIDLYTLRLQNLRDKFELYDGKIYGTEEIFGIKEIG